MDLFVRRTFNGLGRVTYCHTRLICRRAWCGGDVVLAALPHAAVSSRDRYALHLPPKLKSSNNVTLSAFVQAPTLPASEKLASPASITFVPSKVTVK